MFQWPYRYEYAVKSDAIHAASAWMVLDAHDQMVCYCVTDVHAIEVCDLLNHAVPLMVESSAGAARVSVGEYQFTVYTGNDKR